MTEFPDLVCNHSARDYHHQLETDQSPQLFHSRLPDFEATPLVHLSESFFGFDQVFVKDESKRIGLPSFKILGASWGTFRSIAKTLDMPLDADLEVVRSAALKHKIHLVTATDGNHGRAIARMASLLGIEATVFVPETLNEYGRKLIRGEGAKVLVEFGDYDASVLAAYNYAREFSNHLLIQDTSFENYHDVPAWIVQGYSTMFQEIEEQLYTLGLKATHVFTPVGVGSLAHAVVAYCKSERKGISVIAVESDVAACLQTSLRSGTNTSISTKMTIMDGINCGTVSDISWPVLKHGVDCAITISDIESHDLVLSLSAIGVNTGPCGASTSAALKKLARYPAACLELGIDKSSVIVLLNTEGAREYIVPKMASTVHS